MDWETSNSADVNTSLGNEDMDGFNGDDFLAALEGNDGLEDQQTAAEGAEETVQDGAENQRAEEQHAAVRRPVPRLHAGKPCGPRRLL